MWLRGLLRRRSGRSIAIAAAIAIAVSLLASIGAFIAHSKATMTERAAATVGVDWQVEGQGTADARAVLAATSATPGVRAAELVQFAQVSGLSATIGQSTSTTGAGVALGLPSGYAHVFPSTLRTLAGSANGIVVAQQTAANLHVTPGSVIQIARPPLRPAMLRVAGVVDFVQADSLFQKVGAPPGSQPQAPPDNVVAMPAAMWHRIFDPLGAVRPDLVKFQVHVRLDHHLAHDPGAAFTEVVGRAHHLEAALSGAGLVGDNLASVLDAARSDAVYAELLFLFLGVPGVVLAGLVTAAVADSGTTRRRSEQALLRTRGATTRTLVRLAIAEAAVIALLGAVVGVGVALVLAATVFHQHGLGPNVGATATWAGISAAVAFAVAGAAVTWPAWRDARSTTVANARRPLHRAVRPLWLRLGVDGWLLAAGVLLFWLSSKNGYQLVLAPEGVPSISVNYWPLAAPALIWIGGALLGWRLGDLVLRHGRTPLGVTLRRFSGGLSDTVAASMQRQRQLLTRGVVLVALAVTFAASSAVFNDTYRAQANVDALLTNGADVVVNEPPTASVPVSFASRLSAVRGVRRVETLQHRFAYVGADLQDLYGVDPRTIVGATKLQNAYFQGGTARQLIARLASHPDGVLVSAETAHDFQLQPGDLVRLRLANARTGALVTVPFHYAGIAKEFPTAPRDSFLVANRDYIAQQTGSDAVGAFLISTSSNRGAVARDIRRLVGNTATVRDLDTTRNVVGSSLTAVDLSGLTKIELGFAIVLVVAVSGLALLLGFIERRRTITIAISLGASRRQAAAFVWSESVFVAVAGLLLGALGGWALASVIVKVLTGVFDPPPTSLAVPWLYLFATVAAALVAVSCATIAAVRNALRTSVAVLRDV